MMLEVKDNLLLCPRRKIFIPIDKIRLTRTNVRIIIQIPTRKDNRRRQLNILMRAHVAPKKKCGDG